MTPRNPTLARAGHLLAGHQEGAHTLPQSLLDALARAADVDGDAAALRAPAVTEDEAMREAAWAVLDGKPLDVTGVAKAREQRRAFDVSTAALRYASDFAADAAAVALTDAADEIVHEHLAPAQAAVLDAIGAAHQTYSAHGGDSTAMLAAPKPARDAWLAMDALVLRFSLIRRSVGSLRLATGTDPAVDHQALFATVRNAHEVWPAVLGNRNMSGGNTPPWPDDLRGYALYLTRPDVEAWCPTGAEQDARWHDVFDDRIRTHQAGLRELDTFRQVGAPAPVTSGLVVPTFPGHAA